MNGLQAYERLLTQLRAEGYDISKSYQDADLVVVNTCGFIDSAVKESMDAIGEAVKKNGKVIVTGCLGAKKEIIEKEYPDLLAITGPHALNEVMTAVHANLKKRKKHSLHARSYSFAFSRSSPLCTRRL